MKFVQTQLIGKYENLFAELKKDTGFTTYKLNRIIMNEFLENYEKNKKPQTNTLALLKEDDSSRMTKIFEEMHQKDG